MKSSPISTLDFIFVRYGILLELSWCGCNTSKILAQPMAASLFSFKAITKNKTKQKRMNSSKLNSMLLPHCDYYAT